MQDPAYNFIPRNPSLGLRLLTPIVPAADNRPALFLLTTAQCLFGLTCLTRRTPRVGEGRLFARLATAMRFVSGSCAIFLSGLEYTRLVLPYDPWADEARYWRQWAIKNGQKPLWWFGGGNYYSPMSMQEWKDKTVIWIENTANALEAEDDTGDALNAPADALLDLGKIPIGPHTALKAAGGRAYSDIYQSLAQVNDQKASELLSGDLASVSELNKAARMDAILEGSSRVVYNAQYTKPHVQLGTHVMDSDDDFDMVWANFEPWEELRQETDFDIRLIPRWRSADEPV